MGDVSDELSGAVLRALGEEGPSADLNSRFIDDDGDGQDEEGAQERGEEDEGEEGDDAAVAVGHFPDSVSAPPSLNLESLKVRSPLLYAAERFTPTLTQDLLRCVSCRRFLFPPILQCQIGHMVCRQCFNAKGGQGGQATCGKCGQRLSEVPARLAEMITEQFRVACSHADKGCREVVAFKVNISLPSLRQLSHFFSP